LDEDFADIIPRHQNFSWRQQKFPSSAPSSVARKTKDFFRNNNLYREKWAIPEQVTCSEQETFP
jgi:hypothetical protein